MEDEAHLMEQSGQMQQASQAVRLEGGCCLPVFSECGPDTCGLPLAGDGGQESVRERPILRNKVVKLTRAGAQRLFNGEDDEIYSREDLIEGQPDGSIKVTGACTGTVWLVQQDEIVAIVAG